MKDESTEIGKERSKEGRMVPKRSREKGQSKALIQDCSMDETLA